MADSRTAVSRRGATTTRAVSTHLPVVRRYGGWACVGLLALLGGCALAPQTMPTDARPLGAGQNSFAAEVLPANGFRYSRGITDRLDLGVQVEPVIFTGQAKYTVLQSTSGVALALFGALSTGPFNSYSSRSLQAGPMASFSRRRWQLTAAVRYNSVRYDPELTDNSGPDAFGIEVFDDALEDYWTGDAGVAFAIGSSGVWIKTGVSCVSYELRESASGPRRCMPVAGVTFQPK